MDPRDPLGSAASDQRLEVATVLIGSAIQLAIEAGCSFAVGDRLLEALRAMYQEREDAQGKES